VADAFTTLDRGGFELNPMFGRHPSPGKQAGITAGIFAAKPPASSSSRFPSLDLFAGLPRVHEPDTQQASGTGGD
jgi:hypothetical protein